MLSHDYEKENKRKKKKDTFSNRSSNVAYKVGQANQPKAE